MLAINQVPRAVLAVPVEHHTVHPEGWEHHGRHPGPMSGSENGSGIGTAIMGRGNTEAGTATTRAGTSTDRRDPGHHIDENGGQHRPPFSSGSLSHRCTYRVVSPMLIRESSRQHTTGQAELAMAPPASTHRGIP